MGTNPEVHWYVPTSVSYEGVSKIGRKQLPEKHSHPDFQNGRPHDVDRKHRILGERRQRKGGNRKDYESVGDGRHDDFYREYRAVIEAIPIKQLRGHQLELRKICGNCNGPLNHPVDGHYHSTGKLGAFHTPICCTCLEPLQLKVCPGPIPAKDLKGKVTALFKELPYHYYICNDCGRKFRSRTIKEECSECESEDIKEVKNPDATSKSRKQSAKRSRV